MAALGELNIGDTILKVFCAFFFKLFFVSSQNVVFFVKSDMELMEIRKFFIICMYMTHLLQVKYASH